MNLKPRGVLDVQLYHAGVQWKLRSGARRSGISFVLKSVAGVERQEGDSAVQAAMVKGNRAVWDVRPLPHHFLEYAAGDVRHILHLSDILLEKWPQYRDAAERLSARYVDHYAIGKPVVEDLDPTPSEVSVDWLSMFFGPGGVCAFCQQKGHTESECFKKKNHVVCGHCGETGHVTKNCFKKFPQLLKCTSCGQIGHTASHCFRKNPCKHCGGNHLAENCLRQKIEG
jgi:hypothetical protein